MHDLCTNLPKTAIDEDQDWIPSSGSATKARRGTAAQTKQARTTNGRVRSQRTTYSAEEKALLQNSFGACPTALHQITCDFAAF
jgi:hypothetical protein